MDQARQYLGWHTWHRGRMRCSEASPHSSSSQFNLPDLSFSMSTRLAAIWGATSFLAGAAAAVLLQVQPRAYALPSQD